MIGPTELVLLLLGVVIVVWFLRGNLRSLGRNTSYQRLLKSVLGDRATAERLIDYELKRDHTLTRNQAIDRALGKIEYERGR